MASIELSELVAAIVMRADLYERSRIEPLMRRAVLLRELAVMLTRDRPTTIEITEDGQS